MLFLLPGLTLPDKPYEIEITFEFSSKRSDIDNPVKPFLDILQKKYKFDDADIYRLIVNKLITTKGSERISFAIRTHEPNMI